MLDLEGARNVIRNYLDELESLGNDLEVVGSALAEALRAIEGLQQIILKDGTPEMQNASARLIVDIMVPMRERLIEIFGDPRISDIDDTLPFEE